mgnify:FL=1
MRNPIDRAWSLALMNIKHFNLDYENVDDKWFIEQFMLKASISRGDYSKILENWYTFFPKEQIQLINYDDISYNPLKVLKETSVFIGANKNYWNKLPQSLLREKVFSNEKKILPKKFYKVLIDIYENKIDKCSSLIPWDIKAWYDYKER